MKQTLIRPTDEQEAAIQAGIAVDPDNPEWSAEDFAHARAAVEVMAELVRRRGDQRASTKQLISLRRDRDVLGRLRARGPDWQSHVNATLRIALGLDDRPTRGRPRRS